MFIFSFKVKRVPLIVGGALLALALAVGIVSSDNLTKTAPAEGKISTSAKEKLSGKTNDERIAFLAGQGWQVSTEPLEILEVIIPKEFDDIYTKYNEMQQEQGFDLSGEAGRRCKRYAYRIENYPGVDEPVRAHVLVYKDKIIGGDISSEIAGSFMHGFTAPEHTFTAK